MPTDIDTAVAECITARNAGAAPLVFSAAAAAVANDRTKGQFLQSLPQIQGGFDTVRPAVLKAATLFGELARALARFHNSSTAEITPEDAAIARFIMEEQCRLKIAKTAGKPPAQVNVSDGLVCS